MPDPTSCRALKAGLAAGRERMEQALEHGSSPQQNGWNLTYHVFDYNLDFFEVGALDDPAGSSPTTRAATSAAPCRPAAGCGAITATRPPTRWSTSTATTSRSTARPLRVRFETTPPVDAFWSVTMYDTPDFYLVENPIRRYSIGDRTAGLHYADDGSLTVVIQHDAPGARAANGCPRPGQLPPDLAHVRARSAVFDGSYELPPITRLR